MTNSDTEDSELSDGCAKTGCVTLVVVTLLALAPGPCSWSAPEAVRRSPKSEENTQAVPNPSRPRAIVEPPQAKVLDAPKPPSELELAVQERDTFLQNKRCPELPPTSKRFWVDSTGAHGIDGTVEGITPSEVIIKKEDGKTVKVPRTKLATLDQKFLTENFDVYLQALAEWQKMADVLDSRIALLEIQGRPESAHAVGQSDVVVQMTVAQIAALERIVTLGPRQSMTEIAIYLHRYEPELEGLANSHRNAWQSAAFNGNFGLMQQHYQALRSVLGDQFLGYYFDVHEIMNDPTAIRKILKEAAEYRRVNGR